VNSQRPAGRLAIEQPTAPSTPKGTPTMRSLMQSISTALSNVDSSKAVATTTEVATALAHSDVHPRVRRAANLVVDLLHAQPVDPKAALAPPPSDLSTSVGSRRNSSEAPR